MMATWTVVDWAVRMAVWMAALKDLQKVAQSVVTRAKRKAARTVEAWERK